MKDEKQTSVLDLQNLPLGNKPVDAAVREKAAQILRRANAVRGPSGLSLTICGSPL